MDEKLLNWLLQSNPWTKYGTLTEILNKPEDNHEVISARKEMLNNEQVQQLISETSDWFTESITRHNDPKIPHYKLRMLADFGFGLKDEKIQEIVDKASRHYKNNLFTIRQELPQKDFKKPDKQANNWYAMPCDSPLLSYIFTKIGWKSHNLDASIEEITKRWNTELGWFCHFFFVEGQFKKTQTGCPVAGLQALEVFSQIPTLKESEYAKNAFAPIKYHYESGKPLYFFGRSKKFWTLKYPFVWYNALYMVEVLTRFKFLKREKLVEELVRWIKNAKDEDGKYRATSVFMPYKQWDFGNKKDTSPWITFLCYRILNRWEEI